MPGFALDRARFTPVGSSAAPRPRHVDKPCTGLRVRVTDAAAAEPYRLGLELLAALSPHPQFAWRGDGKALTWLLGNDRVGERLRAGVPVSEILAADRADHEAWREARRAALLY